MWQAPLGLFLLAALLGCQRSGQRPAPPPQTITVAYTSQPQCTLIHVALAKGFFAEQGLTIQPVMQTFGKAALATLLARKADFATVAETPLMFSIAAGDPIYVVANIEASNLNNGIVARRDSGIRSLAALKGKRVGFTQGTTSDFFLDSMLTAAGLNRSELTAVPLKPEAMLDAILTKQVDAVCTWNYPLAQIKRQLGSNGVIFFDREIYTETFNLVTQQDFALAHPDTVQRFLRALLKAESLVAARPAEAQAILAAATGTPQQIIQEVWSAFNYRVRLDSTLLITLEDETRWAMKNQLTAQTVMPDYRKFIYAQALTAVKPEAVTIHR